MVRIEREKNGSLIMTFVSDQLTKEDYFKILPALQHTVNDFEEVRWYFEIRDFSGWEPLAALQELRFDVDRAEKILRVAITGPEKWQEWLTKSMSLLPFANVRCFGLTEKEQALMWIRD